MSESAAFLAPLPVTPEVSPLVTRLVEQFAAQWIDLDNLDAWLAQPGDALLLLCGDPVRYPESLDVAVILPELCKALVAQHGCHLRLGVGRRAAEEALAERFALRRWPSIIWLRDGGYVTQIGVDDAAGAASGASAPEGASAPLSPLPAPSASAASHP